MPDRRTAYPGTGIAAAVERLNRDPEIPDHIDPTLGLLFTVMTSRRPEDLSAYDLTCRSAYDLMCRSVFGASSPLSS